LKVVCIDYPRPELDDTVNFIQASYLSSTFRASPRPTKPLKVVIAGAGNIYPSFFFCIKILTLLLNLLFLLIWVFFN